MDAGRMAKGIGADDRLVGLDRESRDFDWLVLATTNTSNDELYTSLANAQIDMHIIGDAVASRTAHMAIYEGRKLGLML